MKILNASLRGSLLMLFPVGWLVSYDLLAFQHEYYLMLTLVAMLASFIILSVLGRHFKKVVHLWVIFIFYLIGYFFKFYFLCYTKLNSQLYDSYLDSSYPLETELLNNSELIISYYETVTLVLVAFAMLVYVLVRSGRKTVCKVMSPLARGIDSGQIKVRRRTINRLLAVIVTICVFLLYLQVSLGLGFTSGADRQVTQLPFRLAGVIMTVINGVLPLMFLITIWLADCIRAASLARLAIICYILFGVTSGLISTSRMALVFVMVSLFVLWLSTGSFTQERGRLLAILVLFMVAFNIYLSFNRALRNAYPDMGIFEIAAMVVHSLLSLNSEITIDAESIPQIAKFLGPFLRINGADSLLNIINYSPSFSFDRIWNLLFESQDTVAIVFAMDVLGSPPQPGLGFSTSLIGYFLFVFGNILLVPLCMIVYTLIWHMIFWSIMNARLMIEPILITLMIITLGQFTSEGSLEAMPQAIFLVVTLGIIGEFFLRRSFGNRVREALNNPRKSES
jgi:hypothetical protein